MADPVQPNQNVQDSSAWLHFEGQVYFVLKANPFRLLLRARGRKISHRELIAELDYLEHDFVFSAADLTDLFPIGGTLQLQLSSGGFDTAYVVATGEVLERHFQAHSLQIHIGFKRVEEELEDLLAELRENGGRATTPLH